MCNALWLGSLFCMSLFILRLRFDFHAIDDIGVVLRFVLALQCEFAFALTASIADGFENGCVCPDTDSRYRYKKANGYNQLISLVLVHGLNGCFSDSPTAVKSVITTSTRGTPWVCRCVY